MHKKVFWVFILLVFLTNSSCRVKSTKIDTSYDRFVENVTQTKTINIITKVNNHWQGKSPETW